MAFYPALCSDQREAASWTSNIPLLVLFGTANVWTPLAPCQNFIAGALARGSRIELHTYPGAYHAFDAPDRPLRRLPLICLAASGSDAELFSFKPSLRPC